MFVHLARFLVTCRSRSNSFLSISHLCALQATSNVLARQDVHIRCKNEAQGSPPGVTCGSATSSCSVTSVTQSSLLTRPTCVKELFAPKIKDGAGASS